MIGGNKKGEKEIEGEGECGEEERGVEEEGWTYDAIGEGGEKRERGGVGWGTERGGGLAAILD